MRDRRVLDDRQVPLLLRPSSSWAPPDSLPDLRGLRIGLDTETRDDGLARGMGPGWVYKMGYIAGISIAWGTDDQIYVPVRHPETSCFGMEEVLNWISSILEHNEIIFHNISYDMGWLREAGVRFWPARVHDTQYMAVLLDENHDRYSLDDCCKRAGVQGKDETLLDDALAAWGVPMVNGSRRHGIWRLPAAYVGPYAEQDARATLDLATRLLPLVTANGLTEAYRTEMELAELIYHMRKRGIRISHEAAEVAQEKFRAARDEALRTITERTMVRVSMSDMMSPEALGRVFDAEGLPYPRTPKTGQPSFQRDWLESQEHWLPGLVRQARRMNDMAEKFVGTYILDFSHQGRIHAEIHQLRDESGGTRTYRFSYSNPPLQQMPARYDEDDAEEEALIRAVRAILLPEDGELWGALDYSQQEPRLAVHYAAVAKQRGADDAIDYYANNPKADFHRMVADMAGIDRWSAKIINLALMYGMGVDKLLRRLRVRYPNMTDEEGAALLAKYHERVPWVRGLSNFCSNRAQARGVIQLIDGAKCHFDHWAPRGQRAGGVRIETARQRWPGAVLERVSTHKAMNRLVQGSAARQTKRAMLLCWKSGIVPLLQMHDEIGHSFGAAHQVAIARDAMMEAVQTMVPMKVDCELGPSWGLAKEKDLSKFWPVKEAA